MTRTIAPGPRTGEVTAPASKSQAHRLLICAALGERDVTVRCGTFSKDMEATAECLRALGACIEPAAGGMTVSPIRETSREHCFLPCAESGSTLRFLLPVAGALGARGAFHREGRLPERPMDPLAMQLRTHGMTLQENGAELHFEGSLQPGEFSLPGNVSSQFISGLLLALPLLEKESRITITGAVESGSYIIMTEDALAASGVYFERFGQTYLIPGKQKYALPESVTVEGDWSGAAFFLCMGALSPEGILVRGLNSVSAQGDRAVLDRLRSMGALVCPEKNGYLVRRGTLRGTEIDAAPIPDLIPALSIVAALCEGETRIVNASRLRHKESDRLSATAALIRDLGGQAQELPDGLVITGVSSLRGGTADVRGDHRIAMAAAAAAGGCTADVVIPDSECAGKSYPAFWNELEGLRRREL